MGSLVVPLLRLASDQRLAELVSTGSARAFEVLYDRHHRPVLAFCRHMLGSIDEAEDVLQHTFEAAYRDLQRSGAPAAVRPWLFVIARNRCISVLRARRELPSAAVPDRGTDRLVADVALREELRAVLAGLARLPDDQRAALVLSELGDVTHDEIARILDCRREQVKSFVFQARSALAADRVARDTPCADIREQLATARGAQLRRTSLRRHVDDCPGCREFRETLRAQRRQLRALLPVVPAFGLKRAVLGTVLAGGGGGGVTLGGVAATALIVIAIPVGGVAMARDDAPSPSAHATATPASRAAIPSVALERPSPSVAARSEDVTAPTRASGPGRRDAGATTGPAEPGDAPPAATSGPPSALTPREGGPSSGGEPSASKAPDTTPREPTSDDSGRDTARAPGQAKPRETKPRGMDRAPGQRKARETKPRGTDGAPGQRKARETKPRGTDGAPGQRRARETKPRGTDRAPGQPKGRDAGPRASDRAPGQAKGREAAPASGQAKTRETKPRDPASDHAKPRETSPDPTPPASDRATPPGQAKAAEPPAGSHDATPAETPQPDRPSPGNSGSAPGHGDQGGSGGRHTG